MELFLCFVILVLAIALFKIRKGSAETGPNYPAPSKPFLDQALETTVLRALRRIEDKVDALAAARSFAPEPVPMQGKIATPASVSAAAAAPLPRIVPEPLTVSPSLPPIAEPLVLAAEADSRRESQPLSDAPPAPPDPTEPAAPAETPPFRPAATEAPPAWVLEVETVLRRIWSWILVGEEHRTKGVPLEFAMAGTWLMRIGVVVLVSCVGWFLKWSMDHGMLAPSGRVGLSFAAGVGMLIAGYRQMGKRYQVLGQGLMGGGLAAMFFAGYASGPLYHLLPQIACFAMMALITLAGAVVASGTRSQATAILAMMGGYLTPVLLRTGSANFPGLYGYLFVLGGGILYLAVARNWRLLHYLTFIAHWALVMGSLSSYRAEAHFAIVLPFLIAFFLQQHAVAVGYALRRAVPITLLEAVHQFVLAGLFAALGYKLIQEAAGRPWPAALAIGAGLLFIAQTLVVLRRLPGDRLSLSVSLGLAGFFTAWSVPLLVGGSTLTIAWSLMALAWLWTGLRIRSRLLVLGSQILFLLAGIRLGTVDLVQGYFGPAMDESFARYLRGFGMRALTFGVFIGSLFASSVLYRRSAAAGEAASAGGGTRVPPEADVPFGAPLGAAGLAVFFVGLLTLFITVHLEAGRLLAFHAPLRAPGILLIWIVFAGYLASRFRRFRLESMEYVAAGAVMLVCLRALFSDWPAMGFSLSSWRFDEAGWQIAYRSLAHAALLALVILLGRGRIGPLPSPELARAYRVGAVAILFVVLSLETRTLAGAFLPKFQAGALSVLWALFAMGLVAAGLKWKDRQARLAGLGLFAVVSGKVFLSDLARLDMIWRVLSFMTVGAALLLGSFAYLRASRPQAAAEPDPDKAKEAA